MGVKIEAFVRDFKVARTTWRNHYDPHNRNNRQSLPGYPRILGKTINLVVRALLAASNRGEADPKIHREGTTDTTFRKAIKILISWPSCRCGYLRSGF